MATGTRALTLKLLADVDNFTKNLKGADKDVQTFGDKVSAFGKKAGLAFAAAGAAAAVYAGKLLKDGVQAAIADEKANALLANTLRNVAGATDETIEKTLDYTRATELATGVTEDELRPSLNRLTIATGSVQKAIQLQTLALNVSAGSGKSLEAVTQALAKAQEGNTASLVRLGIGLSAAQLKTMSMDDVTKSLANTFEGASATAADTYEGKMKRLGLAFEDVRDTVGVFVLDAITPFVETIVNKVMPALDDFGSNMMDRLQPIIKAVQPILQGLRNAFNTVRDSLARNNQELTPFFNLMKAIGSFAKDTLAPILGKTLGAAFEVLGSIISGVITVFATFVNQITKIYNTITGIIDAIRGAGSAVGNFFSQSSMAMASPAPTPPSNNFLTPIMPSVPSGPRISYVNQVTVNGAIDSESTARQIVSLLNDSSARGTLGGAGIYA
jgi:phage-related protein